MTLANVEDWETNVEEVSANVFRVRLNFKTGTVIEATGANPEEMIEKIIKNNRPSGFDTHTLVPATVEDSSLLAELRVEAMRPSLEALGRFDPERARNRFLDTFSPEDTWKLVSEGGVAGFYVLRDMEDHLYLDHLYIAVEAQGAGVGASILEHIKTIASKRNLSLRLMALKESPANKFYLSRGFVFTGDAEFDNFYEWRPTS